MLHPQIETFLLVVESGSFSKAAERRTCSTVAIMNQINSLENRLGLKLLERSSHGIALTNIGKNFYDEARKLKDRGDRILLDIKRMVSGQLPTITVGNSFLRPCKPLFDFIQQYGEELKGLYQFKIVSFGDDEEDFSRLRAKLGKDVDCFVSPYGSSDWLHSFSVHHLGYYRCCVSVPAGHALAEKEELLWDDLTGETLVLVKQGLSPIIDKIRYDIEQYHPDINILNAPGYYDVETFNMCQQNAYILETPEIWANIHPGLKTVPVSWPYRMPFGLIYSKSPSPVFEDFIRNLDLSIRKSKREAPADSLNRQRAL